MNDIKSLESKLKIIITVTILFALVVKLFFEVYDPDKLLIVTTKFYGFVSSWIFVYVVYELSKKSLKKIPFIISLSNALLLINLFLIASMILYLTNIEWFSGFLFWPILAHLYNYSLYASFMIIPFFLFITFFIVFYFNLISKRK